MPAGSSVHEFGPFRLDSAERLLLRAGHPVSVTPKAFDLLVYLIDHAGRLVTKQALMSALWPDSFVEEAIPSSGPSADRSNVAPQPSLRFFVTLRSVDAKDGDTIIDPYERHAQQRHRA